MRILQVSHYFPPETPGGTQEYVAQLARLLKTQGHEVGVVAGCRHAPDREPIEFANQDSISTWRIPRDPDSEALTGDLGSERIASLVLKIASEFEPDLVHVHHWHALTRDLVRLLKAQGHTVVLTLHDLFTTCPRSFRMPDARSFCSREVTFSDCATCIASEVGDMPHAELETVLTHRFAEFQAELAAASAVLAVSDPQRRLLESIPGFEFRGITVSGIGIQCDDPPPTPPTPLAGKLRIVNWAGLDPRKGIHVLLEALRSSPHRHDFEVHLWGREGEPEYMRELRALSEDLNVSFHGGYEDSERRKFAARYDLVVFPFLAFETHALVVDEALRFGIPLIVSDHGAPPERIGTCGLAVPPGDTAALQSKLEHLLMHPEDLHAMRTGTHSARDLREHFADLSELYVRLSAPNPR